METPAEALWEFVETLLRAGTEPLAERAFRWCLDYAFLCGLKDAPCPVVITKYEDDYRPVRTHLDSRAERAWGTVAMSYRANNPAVAKRSFIRAVENYYRYAIKASEAGALDDRTGVWSINKWH